MRVIAGRFGSRRLHVPPGTSTRPTADRVREAIFSVLGDVSGLRVLDLYAGSGALGIEALSRGAVHATFVEAHAASVAVLRKNLTELDLDTSAHVLRVPVERAQRVLRAGSPYDLVFADPPWKSLPEASEDVFEVLSGGMLAPGAPVLLEHPTRLQIRAAPATGFRKLQDRSWGDTQVSWFVEEIEKIAAKPGA
jgi:16S rRNA (guanine966-N2)-methyltransferase